MNGRRQRQREVREKHDRQNYQRKPMEPAVKQGVAQVAKMRDEKGRNPDLEIMHMPPPARQEIVPNHGHAESGDD